MKQHIRTSFDYIRRAPFQALAAISVLALTFFVTTLLVVLLYSSHQVIRFFETRPQVIAFLKEDATQGEIDALRNKLANDSRINSMSYVSKEQALEIYKEATADNPLLGELVSPSIFPASIEFSVRDLNFTEEIIDEVKGESVVESVDFTANLGSEAALGDVIQRLKNVTYYLRIGGVSFVLVLSLTSLLVLMVVIGMRISMKKTEIESLSLIGATNWFIRMPIVFEAINYAIIGVFAGWLAASVLLMYATPSVLYYFKDIPVLPRETADFFALLGVIFAAEILAGLFIAFLGSMIAVSRSLRIVK